MQSCNVIILVKYIFKSRNFGVQLVFADFRMLIIEDLA